MNGIEKPNDIKKKLAAITLRSRVPIVGDATADQSFIRADGRISLELGTLLGIMAVIVEDKGLVKGKGRSERSMVIPISNIAALHYEVDGDNSKTS